MKKEFWKIGLPFSMVTGILGFMFAVQFQSIKEPIVRDTRDMWELREDLKKEQELQVELLNKIRKYEEIYENYRTQHDQSAENALRETLEQLKSEAGLTEVVGQGVILTVEPLFTTNLAGTSIEQVSPELLKRTINELNAYGAEEIAINGHRIINSTVIRNINGITKIDGYNLNQFPITIHVITSDAEKLFNRINGSTLKDDYAIDNLSLSISDPQSKIVVPPFKDTIRIKHMQPLNREKEGKS
ncbi:DUF881 domain-containing protein [Aeribacillus alveayuensis]|uniref:Uncharacterized protein YlxW (UPF0749 family) n=1 Tax=Aeribacillus alveayuensis TaxID=279215 RepID=A0ABT9VL99_9BACI|nr:uncharacterized protein YlxW (UPF0749 family) [Bacillus alveayuensis]